MTFRSIVRYIPLYTGLLIFLGYLNLHYYYKYFDINIYEFINTGELILSFLPILLNTLLVCGLLFISFVSGHGSKENTSEHQQYEIQKFDSKLQLKLFKERYSIEYLNTKSWFKQIVFVLFSPIVYILSFSPHIIAIGVSIGVIIDIILNPKHLYELKYVIVSMFSINYLFYSKYLTTKLETGMEYIFNKNMRNILNIMEVSLIVLFLTYIINVCESYKVLDGKPEYNISFSYKDSTYKSDTNFVYVGKTQNYLFIHNISSHTNSIFPMNDLSKLQMIKNTYK